MHPVVSIESVDDLNFSETIDAEVKGALKDVRNRKMYVEDIISNSIKRHKITLRNHIIFIRDNLRQEFDNFFNNLLQSVRKDWNLFTVEEVLIKQTKTFNETVTKNLEKITDCG